jgi:hypothetical protein
VALIPKLPNEIEIAPEMNAAGAAVLDLDASHIVDGHGNPQTNAAHTVAEKSR